ncbi:hypothetical protein SVAN01_01846 [Stagonosporopsis vannaccii]|nr:hypothetical protein SVAN01_01846 [Stagonosporopsis vannaccii]
MPTPPPQTVTDLTSLLLSRATLAAPPPKPKDPALTPHISSLALHPSLEAALHILNHDLPSAHFLVRHMQAPPAVEGMLLHSILHRCEGDMRNALLWLGDVGDACAGYVPKKRGEAVRLSQDVAGECGCEGVKGGLVEWVYGDEGGKRLVGDVQEWRKRKEEGGKEELEDRIKRELGRVVEWCVKKFGVKRWEDASSAWVKNSEEVQKISNDMVSGGKGYRTF